MYNIDFINCVEIAVGHRFVTILVPDSRTLLHCRGQIHVSCIEAMGLATAFKHAVNGRSYLEVHHRVVGSKALHILSLKANHPDDAALWLKDMQAAHKVPYLCHG